MGSLNSDPSLPRVLAVVRPASDRKVVKREGHWFLVDPAVRRPRRISAALARLFRLGWLR